MKVQLLQIPILNDFIQSTHSALYTDALLLLETSHSRWTKSDESKQVCKVWTFVVFDLLAGQTVNPLTQHEMKT